MQNAYMQYCTGMLHNKTYSFLLISLSTIIMVYK